MEDLKSYFGIKKHVDMINYIRSKTDKGNLVYHRYREMYCFKFGEKEFFLNQSKEDFDRFFKTL
jgi:hypothetical protein